MILAIDQGTTGTTCLVVDDELRVRGPRLPRVRPALPASRAGSSTTPRRSGRASSRRGARRSRDAGVAAARRAAIGITNQRETTVLWERRTGEPVAPRDRLAGPPHAPSAARAARRGTSCIARRAPGLVLDPYFSATKLAWLLARDGAARADGELAFGTIDIVAASGS